MGKIKRTDPGKADFAPCSRCAVLRIAAAVLPISTFADPVTDQSRMKIGIIGAGRIGGTLGESG